MRYSILYIVILSEKSYCFANFGADLQCPEVPLLWARITDLFALVHPVKIGQRHPDPVVETSSLSSVNPPDVWYRMSITEETMDRGWLSALQLEAITYAAQVNTRFILYDACECFIVLQYGCG